MSAPEFLSIPERPAKPRQIGLTHVMDKGHTLEQIAGHFAACGDYIDIVKLGWGTSYVTHNLREKLALYSDLGVPVVLGGTLLEVALEQGKFDAWRRWVSELGLTHVEVSDGSITLPTTRSWATSTPSPKTSSSCRRSGPRTRRPSSRRTAGSR